MELTGIVPAVTTPLRSGHLDLDALAANLETYASLRVPSPGADPHEEDRIGGVLVLGSTGEATLLTAEERGAVVRGARRALPAGIPLIAGVPCESTDAAARACERAASEGADAVLVSTPHYYREAMTAGALAAHLSLVADRSPVPVWLYNVPKFTGLELPPEAVFDLSGHFGIVGIKDSAGDLARMNALAHSTPAEFRIACGAFGILDRALAGPACAAILAAAVAIPEPCIAIARDVRRGETDTARATLEACARIARPILDAGVAGLKHALDVRGLRGGEVRSPLRPVDRAVGAEIERAIATLELEGFVARTRLAR